MVLVNNHSYCDCVSTTRDTQSFEVNYWTEQSDEDLKQLIEEKLELLKKYPKLVTGMGLSQEQAEFITSKRAYSDFFEGHVTSMILLDPTNKFLSKQDVTDMIQENMKNFIQDKRMRKLVVEVWENYG